MDSIRGRCRYMLGERISKSDVILDSRKGRERVGALRR